MWQQATGAALAIVFTALVPLSTAFADTKPYFRTLDGGPFTGGWFNNINSSCSSSGNYQSPFVGPSTNRNYRGAIMGWANLSNRPGASSSLDAFATGLIEGPDSSSTNSPNYGFYTGLPTAGPSPNGSRSLSFSNSGSSVARFWGGIFEGAALNAHCIPDYYNTKQDGTPPAWSGNFSASSPTNQFRWGGGDISGTVPLGKTVIIFASGDVRITGTGIRYASGYTIDNVPKFALVVQGNIYITPGVTQLDGWYIAQPRPSNISGTGVVWTCNNGTSTVSDTFIRSNCNSQLIIKGALTAKQVNLSRISGNLGSGSAEDINFSPEMILGGPFFEGGPGSSTTGVIQSLISLPPVF